MKACRSCGLLMLLIVGEAHAVPTAQQLDQLPKHLVTTKDQVTIFWDWDGKPNTRPLIYFVNRTEKPYPLATFNGELSELLYLEAETAPGKWERAQLYFWEQCGTGWARFELPPGEFVTQPRGIPYAKENDGGLKCQVRLRSYREGFENSSNSHAGVIDPKIIAESKNDSLAVEHADLERLKEIIYGRDPVCQMQNTSRFGLSNPRSNAFAALLHTRHDRKQIISLLQELSKEESPELDAYAKAAKLELQKMKLPK